MKKFRVVVNFSGAIGYDVEAETQEEAEQKAMDMFGDEYDSTITQNIADIGASDCWEERDNG